MAVIRMRAASNTVYFKGISDFDNMLMYYPELGDGSSQGFSNYIENYNSNLSKYATIFIIDKAPYTDRYEVIVYGIIRPRHGSHEYDFTYRENGVIKTDIISSSTQDFNIDKKDIFSDSGVSSLSVTADSGINHVLYNSVTYDTFPATIPLSADSVEMSITSKNKTSSRLGGVIRRVKNRISNLCENRMEVAYGVV